MGVAVALDGTLYVADFSNDRVRAIAHGAVSTIAGSGELTVRDGVGCAAAVCAPQGLFLDEVESSSDCRITIPPLNHYGVTAVRAPPRRA